MKTVATIIASALIAFSFAGTAEANRPVPGYNYPDVCKNIKGKQTILDTVGISARYRVVSPRRCVFVGRAK